MHHHSLSSLLEPALAGLGEACGLGLLLVGSNGRVLAVNHRLCLLFDSPIDTRFWTGADATDVFTRMSRLFHDPDGFLDGIAHLELNGAAVYDEPLCLASGTMLARDFLPLVLEGERCAVLWAFRLRTGTGDTDAVHAHYRRVLEALPAQLAVFSPTGTYEYVTPSAIADEETRAWVIGRTDLEYGLRRQLPREVVAARRARVLECAATGRPSEFEESFTTRENDVRHFRRFVRPVRDADGRVSKVLGYGLDITGQRRAEQELLQVQKLDAVGRLAGGIAHDFNNLLTVIGGYTELATDHLEASHPSRAELAVVSDAVHNASALVRQLMAFSRITVVERVVLDLDRVVEQTAAMARRLVGEQIHLSTAFAPGTKAVTGDHGQLQQVIMNLLVNARDAMPDGGQLELATNMCTLGPGDEATYRLPAGTYCSLVVSDTGVGMTEEVRRRLFEPFFTTKAVGRGTGLGLSIVYGIVADWGGRVLVDSAPGEGTRVRILLPRSADHDRRADERPARNTGLPHGTETVLVAEDDPDILELVRTLLDGLGYHTLTASDGVHAVEVAGEHGGPIDLLLSDVVMPRMNGAELAQHLRRRQPSLKVLFASGYFDDAAVREAVSTHGAAFIAKPFKVHDLAQRVRRVLDSAGDAPVSA